MDKEQDQKSICSLFFMMNLLFILWLLSNFLKRTHQGVKYQHYNKYYNCYNTGLFSNKEIIMKLRFEKIDHRFDTLRLEMQDNT